jgi:hypothetical protein
LHLNPRLTRGGSRAGTHTSASANRAFVTLDAAMQALIAQEIASDGGSEYRKVASRSSST